MHLESLWCKIRFMALSPQPLASGAHGRELAIDTYLTDGKRLLRVVSDFAPDRDSFAWLEDCRTLEVQAYGESELASVDLRVVRSSPPADALQRPRRRTCADAARPRTHAPRGRGSTLSAERGDH